MHLSNDESARQNFRIVGFGLGGLLAACAVFTAGLCFWGFFGSISEYSDGLGVVMKDIVFIKVYPEYKGVVSSVKIAPGVNMSPGEVAMTVNQEALALDIRNKEWEIRSARAVLSGKVSFAGNRTRLEDQQLKNERNNLAHALQLSRARQSELMTQLKDYEDLYGKRYIGTSQYFAVKNDYNNAVQQVMNLQKQLDTLSLTKVDAVYQRDQDIKDQEKQILIMEQDLKVLRQNYEKGKRVLNPPLQGTVTEVYTSLGASVNEDTALYELEISLDDIKDADNKDAKKIIKELIQKHDIVAGEVHFDTVAFFSTDAGGMLKIGMPIRIKPKNVQEEKHGSIMGKVVWVSETPISALAAERIVGSKNETDYLFAGDPVRYHAKILFDRGEDGNIGWTSKSGPDELIVNGTLCELEANVGSKPPIELLIPYLRRTILGVGDEL